MLTDIITSPRRPNVSVVSVTATSISLSWSVPNGSVVDHYEVTWERDTSGECPDEDEGSTTITDDSTDHTIIDLEEDSTYTITVLVTTIDGLLSASLSETTRKAGN